MVIAVLLLLTSALPRLEWPAQASGAGLSNLPDRLAPWSGTAGASSPRASVDGRGPAPAIPSCPHPATPAARCVPALPPTPLQNSSSTWLNITNLSIRLPVARGCYGSAYDPVAREIVLFGGCAAGTETHNGLESDTWTFSQGVWTRLDLPGPPGRQFPSMAYDALDGYVLLFGGDSNGVALNDTWAFSAGHWTSLSPPVSPPARTQAMSTYDTADQYVLLFGGYNTTSFSDQSDTWRFAAGVWSPISPANGTKPSARQSSSIAYDSGDREVVLFGGFKVTLLTASNDTWAYRAGQWTKLATPGLVPKAREQAAFEYIVPLNRTLLFGGDSVIAVLGDLWEFGNGRWTPLSKAPLPSARTETALVWDAADRYAVLFGGNATPPNGPPAPLADSWTVGPNFTSSIEPFRPMIDVRQSVTYYARAVANGSPLFSFRYDGLPPGCVAAGQSTLSCAPTAVGNFSTTINVTASWGSTTAWSIAETNLTVDPLPSITSLTVTPQVLDYNQRFTVRLVAAGGTGVERFSYSGTPSNCPSLNTTVLNCTVNGGPIPGGYPHVFQVNGTVTDSLGGRNQSSVNVTVNADPGIPFGAFEPMPRSTDVGLWTDFVSNASGGTGPLTFDYSGLPSGCAPANLSILPCRPAVTGTFTVNLTVIDSTGYSSGPTATQLVVNPRPQIIGLALTPATLDAGQRFTLVTTVANGTGPVTYGYSGLPPGCAPSATPSLTCVPTSMGNFTLQVTATDSVGGSATMTVRLAVHSDPVIERFGPVAGHVDRNQTVVVSATAAGGTGNLTYSFSGLPKGCSGANGSSVVCPTNDQTALGSYDLRLRVTDGVGFIVTASAQLQVSSDPRVRFFTATPPTVATGESSLLDVVVYGGAGGFAYVYAGLPPGCASNDTSTLTCVPDGVGAFNVSVQATDLANFTASANLRLEVNLSVSPGGSPGWASGSGNLPWIAIGILGAAAFAGLGWFVWRRRGGAPRLPEPETTSVDPAPEPPTPEEEYSPEG